MGIETKTPQVIGYRFAASIAIENRCPDCAAICYDSGLIFHRGDEQVNEDDHGLALDLIDHDGNEVIRIYDNERFGRSILCGECEEPIKVVLPLAALIRFVVSQEDIDGGEELEGPYCPIELAARRNFGVPDARVSEGTLVMGNDVYNLDGVAYDFLDAFYKYGAPYVKPFEIVAHLSKHGI